MCVCVCACVCGERESGVCVSVCVERESGVCVSLVERVVCMHVHAIAHSVIFLSTSWVHMLGAVAIEPVYCGVQYNAGILDVL